MQTSTNPNFYDIFGLSQSATKSEIKKSYYDLAKRFHPDKNKDEDAAEIFKIISEAYIVLSDEQSRKEYDEFLESTNLNFDEFIIKFRKIFGGKQFQSFVGEMIFYSDLPDPKSNKQWIYNINLNNNNNNNNINNINNNNNNNNNDNNNNDNNNNDNNNNNNNNNNDNNNNNNNNNNEGMTRILNLIELLEERVELYIIGEKKNFKTIIKEEAKRMSTLPNESDLLSLLGYLYVREAKKQTFLGIFEKAINSNKYLRKEFETLVKLKTILNDLYSNDFFSSEIIRKMILNGIWLTGRLEINIVIKEVCQRFFDIPEKKLKKKRIKAIKTMGEIFLKYGKPIVDIDIIFKLFELEL
ncbi:hypothetical protein ACTFIW_002760 [Dictyostelium discoideum]